MSYIALYRKWRPRIFEDVVEQEHVVKTLKNSVSTGRIAHAYLFSGTRGTGKTTMAKIFSRAVNCLSPKDGDPCNECEVCRGILSGTILDVVEIDAASNNSVDNVREIRDEVVYSPSKARYKVYIIDEVHMLSSGAFNALLKTLEEPPEHVVFILATTEPHKLPATVLSRCQRFDFRRITSESVFERLEEIASANGLTLHRDAGLLIARLSEGSLRDAISIFDQCTSLGSREITYGDVMAVTGIVNNSFISELADAMEKKDVAGILELIDKLVRDGKDIAHFVSDVIHYFRNLMICKIAPDPGFTVEAPEEMLEVMKQQSGKFSREEIMYVIRELSSLESGLKWSSNARILLEVSLIKLCEQRPVQDFEDMAGRLMALEARMNDPDFVSEKAVRKSNPVPPAASPERELEKEKPSAVEPPKAAAHEGLKGGGYLEAWGDVVNDLKACGKRSLHTYLADTRAVSLDEKVIGIILKDGSTFARALVTRLENQEVIEELLKKKLGRDVRIKCLEESDIKESGPVKPEEEKDELIEKAQDIANRLNIPLNIIDE